MAAGPSFFKVQIPNHGLVECYLLYQVESNPTYFAQNKGGSTNTVRLFCKRRLTH
jgi:hypothetical protein